MKKSVLYILGIILVAIALVLALLFVFGGDGGEESIDLPDLSGNWTVVAVYVKDVPTFVDEQYMVFKDGTASMYKDGKETAFATSSYTVNEASQLLLPDISREYKVDQKSEHCVRLYENADQYMLLIKNKGDSLTPAEYTAEALNGRWDVAVKGDQINNGEVLEFADGTLRYFKQGAAEPFATSEYTLENGVIYAASLGMELRCFATADNAFTMVEQSGNVWELRK